MSISDPLNHLGSIWCHSGPLEVPYSPRQFFDWDFFGPFLQETGSSIGHEIFKNVRGKNDIFLYFKLESQLLKKL